MKIKNTLLLMVSIVGLGLLTGCGAPSNLEMTADAPYEGTLVRGFVPFMAFVEEHHKKGVEGSMIVHGETLTWHQSQYVPLESFLYMEERVASNQGGYDWTEIPYYAASLGAQPGDLIEFYTTQSKFLWADMSHLSAVRIVCKFHDNACIDKERRDRFCKDGVMVADGTPQEGFTCGGFGGNSEKYAAIVGPVDALYGSLDGYFDAHNSTYRHCLVTDMSCGHEEGKAIERDKYAEFLERFPNYLEAQHAANDYMELRLVNEEDTPFRQWAMYLSEHLFDREPVGLTAEDFNVTRENHCSLARDSDWCIFLLGDAD